jgi:hypothetical protein
MKFTFYVADGQITAKNIKFVNDVLVDLYGQFIEEFQVPDILENGEYTVKGRSVIAVV